MPIQISSYLSSPFPKKKGIYPTLPALIPLLGSWAPVFYCLLQLILLTALVFACPYFIDFQNHLHIILFWLLIDFAIDSYANRIVTATTIILYFVTQRKDPGYIPHDAVFFTDQNETTQKQSPVVWK